FRTEKLSLITPMVLRNSGRVGSRRFFREFIPSGQKTRGDDLFIDVGKEGGRITTELMHSFINKELYSSG
ncbi:hypothetical protein OXV68_11505, partial [Bacteroides fragilis]|nr:hypothetical protein [Bacteroides fragilis]